MSGQGIERPLQPLSDHKQVVLIQLGNIEVLQWRTEMAHYMYAIGRLCRIHHRYVEGAANYTSFYRAVFLQNSLSHARREENFQFDLTLPGNGFSGKNC